MQTTEVLDDEDGDLIDELAREIYMGVPPDSDAEPTMQAIARYAFVAGRVFQQQYAVPMQYDDAASVEKKFEIVSAFINFMNNDV